MRAAHLLCGVTLVALGCASESTSPGPTVVASLSLTPATLDTLFFIGETAQIDAVAKHASGADVSGATISFQSSAVGVATVSPRGAVTAVGNGVANITATSGSATASVAVRVRQKLVRVVVVPATGGVAVGGTLALAATAVDARGNAVSALGAPSFSSDNPNTARVAATGVVTGVALGTATITAGVTSPADGSRSGTAVITVTTAPPATATVTMGAATFTPASVEISVGGTVTWVNSSGEPHDVDFGTPAMHIPIFSSGERSMSFAAAGTFAYHCNLHAGMTGSITVR